MEFSLKSGFGYVIGATVGSFFVHHFWMAGKVMAARKKYEVKYPALYADEKNCPNDQNRNSFNCVQRAHQNSLEAQPINLALWCLAGIKGYSTGNPDGRYRGAFQYIGVLLNVGCCLKFAYDLLTSNK